MTGPTQFDPDDYVQSPCIRICRIDQKTRLCEGCLRSLDEIAHWGGMTPDRKRAVLAQLPARQKPKGVFGW